MSGGADRVYTAGPVPVPTGLWALVVLVLFSPSPVAAQSSINRCEGPDGVPIFSDRSCSALGSRDHQEPPTPEEVPAPGKEHPGSLPQDCSREIETLKDWVRIALDNNDVNSLAGLYHWTGASSHAAHSVMYQLDTVVRRSLIDIEIEKAWLDGFDQPVRLWLDQEDPARPERILSTRFSLIRNAGCWWLHH